MPEMRSAARGPGRRLRHGRHAFCALRRRLEAANAGRDDEEHDAEADERTRLLPDDPVCDPVRSGVVQIYSGTSYSPQQRHVVDQERMKERLGVIVRAKEGKMVNLHAPLPFNLHNAVLARSASRVSAQPSLDDDEASQSTSSLSVPADAPDVEPDEPRAPLSVRLVRAAPALRGRSSTRRISPTTLAKRDDTGSASGSGSGSAADAREAESTPQAQPGPSTARALTIQPVGSFSRSWGD
ncbi:hypothetical protein K488DRAFT_74908 [Vararia minispora EC-137]|uniref:Uncharacterized protein n=1 Tax=Vararia minispora EC-137 TaxID=1314806 RepID=A0ACB8Q5T0_9AGAM|nr:hypothetical protein K488DRAFT_74908 [Vararia minispora EC-137]